MVPRRVDTREQLTHPMNMPYCNVILRCVVVLCCVGWRVVLHFVVLCCVGLICVDAMDEDGRPIATRGNCIVLYLGVFCCLVLCLFALRWRWGWRGKCKPQILKIALY